MFKKEHLDGVHGDLRRDYFEKPEYEQLVRDAHMAIALFDAGRPWADDIDPIVVDLIEKYKPND